MSSPDREFRCRICGEKSTNSSADDVSLCTNCGDIEICPICEEEMVNGLCKTKGCSEYNRHPWSK